MSLEATRILADWLAPAQVNALVAEVPRDGGDPAPAAIQATYDRTRHGWVARNAAPRTGSTVKFPALAVTTPVDGQGTPAPAVYQPELRQAANDALVLEGTVTLVVHYLGRFADTEMGARDSGYTLRAVRGRLLQLARAPIAQRTRNGVQLVKLTALQQIDAYDERDDVVITGAVLCTWSTRETTPLIST